MRYLTTFLLFTLLIPLSAFAVNVETFQQIPLWGTNSASSQNIVEALYKTAIAVASILAVIQLIRAGVDYLLSDMVTKKEAAKSKIRNALMGIVIILAAVTILNEINPNVTKIDVIGKGQSVIINSSGDIMTGSDNDPPTIDFEPGDEVTGSEVKSYCAGWTGVQASCAEQYYQTLADSCGENGGTLSSRIDPNISGWDGYSSLYIYTCN